MLRGQMLIFSSLLPYICPSTETRKWNGSTIKKSWDISCQQYERIFFSFPLASQINPKKQSTLCNTDFSLGNVVSSFSTSAVKTYCHPSFAKWFLERPSNEYLAYRGLMYWEPGLVLWKSVLEEVWQKGVVQRAVSRSPWGRHCRREADGYW